MRLFVTLLITIALFAQIASPAGLFAAGDDHGAPLEVAGAQLEVADASDSVCGEEALVSTHPWRPEARAAGGLKPSVLVFAQPMVLIPIYVPPS